MTTDPDARRGSDAAPPPGPSPAPRTPSVVERGAQRRDETQRPPVPRTSPVVERGQPQAARDETQHPEHPSVDVLIVGGGPAGLSAALNLGRARATVAVIDADRPRNAATLRSHGFLTRDGIPPQELRTIARDELAAYPNVTVHRRTRVTSVVRDGDGFTASLEGRKAPARVHARSVLAATGLRETLPDVPNIRGFYGVSLFSCAACDGWELRDQPLALIGQTRDLAARARLVARWSDNLIVFTHGAEAMDAADEAELVASGIRIVREPITELVGDRGVLTGITVASGETVPIVGGFVRPLWDPALEFLAGLEPDRDAHGHLVADRSGRTSVPGLYAAGDAAAPGPQQLIVAAGQGARAAAVIVHDSVGVVTAH